MHLLQIISAQPWPNFLAILALEPSHVTFLTSRDTKGDYTKAIDHINKATQELGLNYKTTTLTIPSENPTETETLATIQGQTFDQVNLTGGTKLMSLAAYQYSLNHQIPSLYIDTRNTEPIYYLDSTQTKPSAPALDRSQITVPIALQLHGFPLASKNLKPCAAQLRFGNAAAALRAELDQDNDICRGLSDLRSQFCPNNKFLEKGKLKKALQNPINPTPGSPWHQYLQAAAENQIIHTEDHLSYQLHSLDPYTSDSKELKSASKYSLTMLEGFWFELLHYHKLQQENPDLDLAWSVEAEGEASASYGETDIIAFDPITLTLHFTSCKSTGPHTSALDHIQGLRTRATKEGGLRAEAHLAIFRARSPDQEKDLENHCTVQKVKFHTYHPRRTPT